MKRALLIVALATVLVFAFASSALAKNAIVQRAGATSTALPVATYSDWTRSNPASPWAIGELTGNAGSTSPHGNYATTTVKCAVCHAVHAASPAGDTLLKVQANQACYYCHVSSDMGVPGKVVYGGNVAIAAAGGAGQDAHTTGTNCGTCHASVHGANAIKNVDAFKGLLLKASDGTGATTRILNPATNAATIDAGSGVAGATGFLPAAYTDGSVAAGEHYASIGLFCQGCHSGSYQNVDSATTTGGVGGAMSYGAYATTQKTGHRVMASVSDNWNAGNSVSSSTKVTGKVAYAAADNCVSCHDAENGLDGDYGFPHFSPGAARFLNIAAYAGAPAEPAGVSVSASAAVTTITPTSPSAIPEAGGEFTLRDGVCLKCHRGNDTSSGVGLDF